MTTAVATCFMVVILPGGSKATNHATDLLGLWRRHRDDRWGFRRLGRQVRDLTLARLRDAGPQIPFRAQFLGPLALQLHDFLQGLQRSLGPCQAHRHLHVRRRGVLGVLGVLFRGCGSFHDTVGGTVPGTLSPYRREDAMQLGRIDLVSLGVVLRSSGNPARPDRAMDRGFGDTAGFRGRSEGVRGVPPGVLDRLMRRKQNSSGGMVNKPWIDVVNGPWTNSAAGLVFPTWRSRLVRQASQAPPPTEPTGLSPITGARQFGSATYQVGDCAKGLCGPRQDALHLSRAPQPIAGGADPACGPVCEEVDTEGAPAFKVEASPRDDNKAHAHILSAIQRGDGTLRKLRNLLLPHLNRQLMELREYARPMAEP
ncbi:hypothetical protein DHODJN_00020 [Methylorubrum extorquens]